MSAHRARSSRVAAVRAVAVWAAAVRVAAVWAVAVWAAAVRVAAVWAVAVRAAVVRVARVVADRWRRRLAGRAADATAKLAGRNLLVLAPHSDDETFGCGALMARARAAGDTVTVVVATDGSRCASSDRPAPAEIAALRRVELRAACGHLGVGPDDTIMLGYGDGTLASRLPQLSSAIAELVQRLRPDVVLVTCAQDQHPDHRALHEAAVTAVSGLTAPPVLLGYPVWTWYSAPFFPEAPVPARLRLWWWAARQALRPRTAGTRRSGTRRSGWWRVPTGPYLAAKRDAVGVYAGQTTDYTGEPGWSYLPPRFVALFLGADEVFLRTPLSVDKSITGLQEPYSH